MNLRAEARAAAKRHGLDPDIFSRQIGQESGFNANAKSPAGALGVAQIMPATARSWGIDPMNPRAALDAAAKNMARMVKQHGSYEAALRGYNAGEGAIEKSKGYAETNDYVRKILGGKSPSLGLSQPSASSTSMAQPTATGPATSSLGFTRQELLQQYVAERGQPGALTNLSTGLATLKASPKIAAATMPTGTTGSAQVKGAGGGQGKLLELFWQGPNGINAKNGKAVPQGFVSGHEDHVHVAAGPHTVIQLGKLAQSMGLHVGENPHFGKVNPVHVANSYHYKGEAIDVSGDPAAMSAYAHKVASMYGIK